MKTRIRAVALTVIGAALSIASIARAEDCAPLKRRASIDFTLKDGRQPLVPVEIADVPKVMLLDTGAAVTVLSEKAANELNLTQHRARGRLYGVTGSYSESYVTAPMKIGNLNGGSIKFMIDPNFGGIAPDEEVAGLLGGDILSNFDVSVDFGTSKLDLLDSHHCEGKVLYWPHNAVAIVPFRSVAQNAIVIKLLLDGKPVQAIVDTGASYSTIRIDAAQRLFGIKPAPEDAAGFLNDRKDLPIYRHVFKTLEFEGIAVSNPELELIPDKLTERFTETATGSHVPVRDEVVAPEILLGMNILSHLHLYIAYKEQKLYLTAAGAKPNPQ